MNIIAKIPLPVGNNINIVQVPNSTRVDSNYNNINQYYDIITKKCFSNSKTIYDNIDIVKEDMLTNNYIISYMSKYFIRVVNENIFKNLSIRFLNIYPDQKHPKKIDYGYIYQ